MTNEEIVQEIQAGKNVKVNLGKLYEQNRGLIVQLVKPFSYRYEMEDLMQDAFVGLQTAAMKYSFEEGVQFNTYASYWIKTVCRRSSDKYCSSIRMPVHMQDEIRRYKSFLSRNENASDEEICDALEISEDKLHTIRKYADLSVGSLSMVVPGTDGMTLEEIISDNHDFAEDVENEIMTEQRQKVIADVLKRLTKKNRNILISHFWKGQTYRDIAKDMNCSFQNVQAVEQTILKRLKNDMAIQSLVDKYEAGTGAMFGMGVKYALDNHTSSTEMAAFRHLELEEGIENRVKKLLGIPSHISDDDKKELQQQTQELLQELEGLLTSNQYYVIHHKSLLDEAVADIASSLEIKRPNVYRTEKQAINAIRNDSDALELIENICTLLSKYEGMNFKSEETRLLKFLQKVMESSTQVTKQEENPEE